MREIVKEAGEDKVVGEFVDGRGGVEKDEGGYEEADVVVVVYTNSSKDISSNEKSGAPRKDTSYTPAAIAAKDCFSYVWWWVSQIKLLTMSDRDGRGQK